MKNLKQIQLVVIIGFAGTISSAFAESAQIRPNWSLFTEQSSVHENSSFLRDQKFSAETNLNNEFWDEKTQAALRQQYDDMTRDYEFKRAYHTLNVADEVAQKNRLQGFSENFLYDFQKQQVRTRMDKASKNLQRSTDDPVARGAAAAMIIAAGAYWGKAYEFRVADGLRMRALSDIRNRRGELGLKSEIVEGNVAMAGKAQTAEEALQQKAVDPTLSNERYKVSLARQIPGINVSSALSYGGSTDTVNASFRKEIVRHVTAEVGSTRPVGNTSRSSEETVKVFYGLTF